MKASCRSSSRVKSDRVAWKYSIAIPLVVAVGAIAAASKKRSPQPFRPWASLQTADCLRRFGLGGLLTANPFTNHEVLVDACRCVGVGDQQRADVHPIVSGVVANE